MSVVTWLGIVEHRCWLVVVGNRQLRICWLELEGKLVVVVVVDVVRDVFFPCDAVVRVW